MLSTVVAILAIVVLILPGFIITELAGTLSAVDYALGARDARQGWDYLFGHLDGGFVILHLKSAPDAVGTV